MMMWLPRWLRRTQCPDGCDEAARARREQERRLHDARRQWPEVHQARDVLADWVEQALRGGA